MGISVFFVLSKMYPQEERLSVTGQTCNSLDKHVKVWTNM